MNNTTDCNATYISPDNQTMVRGFWGHRGGCLWLGEITIVHLGQVVQRFSSTTPMVAASLAMYAGRRA